MFETRVTQSWGASGEILREFLLERLTADDSGSLAMIEARRKDNGACVWLKCQLNHADEKLLEPEAAVWHGISHPHILAPLEILDAGGKPYLVFPWAGEQPFDKVSPEELDGASRLRIAHGLAGAVHYLQGLDEPVAHCRISESAIWLSRANRWPYLTGFEYARRGADRDLLEQDRRDCWLAIQRIVGADRGIAVDERMATAAEHWLSGGPQAADPFSLELERVFVANVTSEL